MSKIHASMKYVTKIFSKVYCAGYADLQFIMEGETPQYYNSGVYGWNCDIYANYTHDAIITTGYRNTKGKRIPSELIKKYSTIAQQIKKSLINIEEIKNALEENRKQFWHELISNY